MCGCSFHLKQHTFWIKALCLDPVDPCLLFVALQHAEFFHRVLPKYLSYHCVQLALLQRHTGGTGDTKENNQEAFVRAQTQNLVVVHLVITFFRVNLVCYPNLWEQ